MPAATITIHGIALDVDYEYTPYEHNNHGHPDNRLPDVDEEVELIGVYVKGVNILSLLSEDVQAEIENNILVERRK